MNNKLLMDLVNVLEHEAGIEERESHYKRFRTGIQIRKRGIAKGLRRASELLRKMVLPDEQYADIRKAMEEAVK